MRTDEPISFHAARLTFVAVTLAVVTQSSFGAAGKATVRGVRGEARYDEKGRVGHVLRVQLVLRAGAVLHTSTNATVDLFLGENGPVLRILSGTELRLKKLQYHPRSKVNGDAVIETELELLKGRILARVKELPDGSIYEVKTPQVTLRIHGTEFAADAEGTVSVLSGAVEVLRSTGPSIQVQSGQTLEPASSTVRPMDEKERQKIRDCVPEEPHAAATCQAAPLSFDTPKSSAFRRTPFELVIPRRSF